MKIVLNNYFFYKCYFKKFSSIVKINKYKMILIIISRIRPLNTSYYIILHLFLKRYIKFISSYLNKSKIFESILIY